MNRLRKANFIDVAMLLFNYRVRYRVEGDSMLPLLAAGDQLVVDEKVEFRVGDVVISRHPFDRNVEMVKRIAQIDERGMFYLVGDNPAASTDSRSFGAVSLECIKGRVISRLKL